MKAIRLLGTANIVTLLFLGIASGTAAAQSTKVQGIIKSRSGPDIILSTNQDPNTVVMLTDSTDVGQVEGVLKARSKQMSMAALIPGLAVSVEGDYNNQKVLVASKVRFKGNDLKNAKAIAAGMHDTNQQVQKNQEELAKHNAELQAQHEALQKHQQAIAANKAAIDAAIARFGQLDDYYIMDEVTIYFANGKTMVDPKYISQITTLAQDASKVDGYMIEVKGYASAVVRIRDLDPMTDAEAVRDSLVAEIGNHDYTFQLEAQLCADPSRMPIENTSIDCSEKLSPFTKIAIIHIPKQDISSPAIWTSLTGSRFHHGERGKITCPWVRL